MKKMVIVGLMTLIGLLVAPIAWAADGINTFYYSYGAPSGDTLSDFQIRGAHVGTDLDGDGKYEIIVTDYDPCGVNVYEVVADDSLEWVWSSATAVGVAYIRQVHTGDMDNDGIGEIIFVGTDTSGYNPLTYEGGIHVYEWDGVIGSDNYGAAPASIYKPNPTHQERFRAEDFAIGDVDGDGKNELVTVDYTYPTITQQGLYILSVNGTFEGAHTWVEEHAVIRGSDPNPFYGSPIHAGIGDMDGDGKKEAIFHIYDYAALYIVETTDTNAYAYQTYLQTIPANDVYSMDCMVVADLSNDGADEVYFNIYSSSHRGKIVCVTGGTDVSAITYASNVFEIVPTGGAGGFGLALGDQDHGPGNDGPDLYTTTYSSGRIYDHELTAGTDPTDPLNWTRYLVWEDLSGNSNGSFGLAGPPVDMDNDGSLELVVTFLEAAGSGKWFRVFEWSGDLPTHDLSVEEISPTYATAGVGSFAATIRNEGATTESNFEVYWKTDTGDSSSDTFTGSLGALQKGDLTLSWDIPDTNHLFTLTVWTDLPGDTIPDNDTLSQKIYNYPSETAQYAYTYTTTSGALARGIGVFGNDDYVVGVTSSPFSLAFYHNAPGPADMVVTQWSDPDTTIAIGYNWGIGIDTDNNVYLCNQSQPAVTDSEAQVLVWDYNGNEVDWFSLGYSDKKIDEDGEDELDWLELLDMIEKGETKGLTYPTALDVDDNGYVYVAWYVEDGTIHDQIEVYSPVNTWSDHQANKQTGFEPGAYVVEGLCVNGDGSVLWVTDRSIYWSLGDVTRWTGSPAGGYTQDSSFAGDGTLEIPGFARGIDLAPDGDIYVISNATPAFDQEKVFIADGTTGDLKYTIDIDALGVGHNAPYDIEFSLVRSGFGLIIEKAEDNAYLSWLAPTSATAFYVTNKELDGYVDKWEGPGFKGVTSYEVHRDTLPEFVLSPTTLLDTTSNNYYLDETSGVGNTGLNHYYIVRSIGTPGYSSKSVTVGEYDRGLVNLKKKGTSVKPVTRRSIRPVTRLQTRPEPTQERASTLEKKRR